MALETLKDIKQIGGFEITRYPSNYNENFIIISEEDNCIAFKLQNGPIKEVGVNGCQIDTILESILLILNGFQEKYPCYENANAMSCISDAIRWLVIRKKDREQRNVEGTSQP